MTSSAEQFLQLRSEVAGLRSRVTGLSASGQIYASSGQRIMYGCKVTQGSSATDMIVALESAASGDSAHLNPDLSVTPTYQFEYPNIAALKSGGFYSADLEATVDAVPATGLGRYDIAYIYVGPTGPGFAIATGTPGAGVKTAFDADGLETGAYDPDTEAAIPVGAFAVARIYVEDDASGIANARIADLRIFGLTAEDLADVENAVASTAADALATAADRVQTGLDAVATAADAVSTAADAVATAADRVQAGLDAAAADADRIAAAGSATDSLNSANASAASAALAAEIVNISEVQFFTNPLAKQIRVALYGSASVRGPMVLDNGNLDMGTNNFTIPVQKRVTTTRPSATETLFHKHDGTTGLILELLTTGHLKLTINATTFTSTAALPSATNVEPVIMVPTVRSTTTTAGSVTFYVDGSPLGTALAISARAEKITNGGFDSDITGWAITTGSPGSIAWDAAGKLRVTRSGSTLAAYQAVSVAAGETLFVSCAATSVSGASTRPALVLKSDATPSGGTTYTSVALSAAASGTMRASYYAATATTVYVHLQVGNTDGVYDFDTVTSIDTYSVDNASNLYLLGTSTTTTEGDYYDAGIYNRALSVAECSAYCLRGPGVADIGAIVAPLYVSDFSAGSDGWTTAGIMTYTGNQDGIGGLDNWLKCERTSGGVTFMKATRTISTPSSLKRRCTVSIYRPTGAGTAFSYIRITDTNDLSAVVAIPADTVVTVTVETTVTSVTSSLTFTPCNSAGSQVSNLSNGTYFFVRGITFEGIGLCARWSAADAQSNTGQIFDQSGNKNHMLLPASGATIVGRPVSQPPQVRGTNEWSASTSTQYVVGTNQNHIPAQAAWTVLDIIASGSVTVHIGDGSDVDRFGASIALVTGRNRVTLATPFVDGTNLKLTLTPTSSFTGTLETTAQFIVLED